MNPVCVWTPETKLSLVVYVVNLPFFYIKYWDILPNHTGPKTRNSSYCDLLVHFKFVEWVANSVDPHQTPRFVAFGQGLHCLLRPYVPILVYFRYITKTCLYNFDPLKPHYYIVKLGFTGVYIILSIFAQNIDCGYSLEPPRRGGSNEYPQSIFWAEI